MQRFFVFSNELQLILLWFSTLSLTCIYYIHVHGILQARILELVVMPSSRGSSWPRDWIIFSNIPCIGRQILCHWAMQGRLLIGCVLSHFSCVQLFVNLWTIACQAPLCTGFSRQEYWRWLPCPPPGNLPKPGIEPTSLMSPALAGGFFTLVLPLSYSTCKFPIFIL